MTDLDTSLVRKDDVPARPARRRSWLPIAFAAIILALIAAAAGWWLLNNRQTIPEWDRLPVLGASRRRERSPRADHTQDPTSHSGPHVRSPRADHLADRATALQRADLS
jgi:hypothetical protein